MAASTVQNTAARPESKSAKKKKTKSDAPSAAAPVAAVAEETAASSEPAPESSNGDGAYESPYIKELYKTIRNVTKKITNASKVDNILAENPKLSLDELVAARKINADQRTQILNKPKLQASLAQLEEQIAQYKKFDQEYKARAQAEKAEAEKFYTDKAAKDLQEAVSAAKDEAAAAAAKEQQANMLIISQFLRLAAARRAEDADSTLEENQALEGVLVEVYSGDENAVAAMTKLYQGSTDATTALNNVLLSVTYAQVKAAAVAYLTPGLSAGSEDSPAVETAEYPVGSDPTIATAGLTELNDPTVEAAAKELAEESSIAPNSSIGEGNATGDKWDPVQPAEDLSASQEWVEVPRDAAETDTGITATPAAASNTQGWDTSAPTQSWADEQPDEPVRAEAAAANGNDGFHEVKSSRGARRGGRGGENGGYRGGRGGSRGDYRGRGRGGPRGGGAPRARRTEES